jgi:two-component system, response regulator YesN
MSHVVFFNLFVPLIAGAFFLLYFVYFVIANPSNATSYRYFIVFLIGFSIFIMGRALQVTAGPHPLPLIVVNVRVFILCAIVSPVSMLTANAYRNKKIRYKEILIICVCVALGLVYVVFNTLGTKGSVVLYGDNGLTIYENLTPSLDPPLYAREVTLAVQVMTGALLVFFSLEKLVRLKLGNPMRDFLSDKNFLINAGILIFAVSFIVGSLARQWWIYYASSIVSALFVGASVLIDIKEIHAYYEKMVPFVKEDMIKNFAFKDFSRIKLGETLRMLGKKAGMDTFAILKIGSEGDGPPARVDSLEYARSSLARHLGQILDETDFMLLPITDDRLGIVLALPKNQPGKKFALLEALETAQTDIAQREKRAVKIGIGRSYDKIEDLRLSYLEALNAQEYASQHRESDVIHAENMIGSAIREISYPVREKERLLAAVRSGDVYESDASLRDFIAKFRPFIEQNPDILKVRLYELAGSLIDSAILGGGDEKKLNDLVAKYFTDINMIKDFQLAQDWLSGIVSEIAGNVGCEFDSRSRTLIESAKRHIEANYRTQIGYKDVAREIFVSPSYFLNLFKKETGMTFTDYLTAVRVREAKTLLRTSGMSITEIAYGVGFNNSNYFSNIFKKATGISAKEYRSGE